LSSLDGEPPEEDVPPQPCRNCGALVSPEIDVYEEDPDGLGPPLGSYARWTCGRCGHTTIVPLSAYASKEDVEQLEKEADQLWRLEHEEDRDQGDE